MAAGLATSIEYRGIDPDLVARCYQIWTDLDRIETKVEDAIREAKTEDLSLCSFVDALVNYKELLRRNLRISAGNASATLNEQRVDQNRRESSTVQTIKTQPVALVQTVRVGND